MNRSLAEWEDYLQPFFGQIKLLGEIPLTWLEVDEIAQGIRALLKRRQVSQAHDYLEKLYPHVFIVYLALAAAHNTDANYWGVIAEALSVSEQFFQQHEWGARFLKLLGKFNLRTFSEVGGYRFVGPIRLHGGIPAYSLPDFFAHILLPSVQNAHLKELPTPALLEELSGRSAVQFFVDSPVRYFLEYGGAAALEFVDNCRKMADAYLKDGDLPAPDVLGLPPYVARSFSQFMEMGQEVQKGRRLRPPYITLNPWGPEFYLQLPPQPVEGLAAGRQHAWQVRFVDADGAAQPLCEKVRVRQRGYGYETDGLPIPLETPAVALEVAFCRAVETPDGQAGAELEALHRWRLRLLPSPGQPPLLAFQPETGQALRWSQALPARDLWLMYPRNAQIQAAGARPLQETYAFYGAFVDWQVYWWDLGNASALTLVEQDRPLCAPIPIQGHSVEPELVGGTRLAQNIDPDGIPVYLGEPPRLRIYLRPGRSLDQELAHWKICLESRWAACPELAGETRPLHAFRQQIQASEQAFELPLSALLGESPAGSYRCELAGPLGYHTSLEFRLWPGLEIDGLQPYYLPCEGRASAVQFTLKLPEGCQAQPQAGVTGLEVQASGGQFLVSLAAELERAELHLVKPLPGGEPVRLPLALAAPRLRWAFPQGVQESEIAWLTSPVVLSVDALLQAEHTALHVEMPLASDYPLLFTLLLADPETGQALQDSRRTHEAHSSQTRWRFPLGLYSDTLRNCPDLPVFEFQLDIYDGRLDQCRRVTLMRLNRKLDVHAVWVEHLAAPQFRLHWQEFRPLRNRRVWIWSEWQPWAPPAPVVIPDDAQGELLVTDTGLAPSRYRMHFFTASPWEEMLPPPEPPPDSHLVETITPQKQLAWLDAQIQKFPARAFLLHFERACVLDTLGVDSERDQEITWCCQNLDKASPEQILCLYRWLGRRDPETHSAIRIYMYRPEHLARLFKVYPQPHPLREAYLQDVPLTRVIKPESVNLLLRNQVDSRLVLHCQQILLKREYPGVVNQVVERIEAGQLSDADAAALLEQKPAFALDALIQMPERPARNRLIVYLAAKIPGQQQVISPGFWVLTGAGWGRISRILNAQADKELEFFIQADTLPVLAITLRPNSQPEEIMLDLKAQSLSFLHSSQVYQCARQDCQFATADLKLLQRQHNHAAHLGSGPAFAPGPATFRALPPQKYVQEAPGDEFLGA